MTNPIYDPYQILYRVYSDGAYVKQAISDVPIEESNRARTVKIVYGVLENDGYFDYCIRHYAPKSPKLPIRVILKIALYMLLFLEKKRYTVTDLAVDLCKKLGKGGASGFVNAFLRNFNKDEVILPKDPDAQLSVRYSMPLWIVKKLRAQYKERTSSILSATTHGVCVRFERGSEEYLTKEHEETPFRNVYVFKNFVRDGGFLMGDYTFQSIGSVAICNAVEDCDALLDACAAPGGKSVYLARRCKRVTSCELHPHRVELIRAYAERMDADNVTAVQADSSVFNADFSEAFDAVLCDVPCSGLGTFCENPDVKLNRTQEGLAELKSTQLAILSNCAKYVGQGGRLYYSTCSILQEENDGIVGSFLKQNADFTVEAIDSPLIHEKTAYGLQFLPDTAYGAGFYVCKLTKKGN